MAVYISSDHLRFEDQEKRSVKFKYSLEFPVIEMNYLDTQKLAFVIKSSNEEYLKIVQFFKNLGKEDIN